jgi:hypothetical protein
MSIIAFKNKDKGFQEKWNPKRDLLDMPWAFRAVFCGPPSSGKSTIVKNIILKARPLYKKVLIVHYGGEGTQDYDEIDGIEVVPLSGLPDPVDINPRKEKMLLVLEDVPLSSINREQKQKIDRLYGYSSSHRGVSVICCAQDAFDVPVGARRSSNVFILWKQPDLNALQTMASRTGFTTSEFRNLFKLCKNKHDSIMIDLTEHSPAPLRFNAYTPIAIKEDGRVKVQE